MATAPTSQSQRSSSKELAPANMSATERRGTRCGQRGARPATIDPHARPAHTLSPPRENAPGSTGHSCAGISSRGGEQRTIHAGDLRRVPVADAAREGGGLIEHSCDRETGHALQSERRTPRHDRSTCTTSAHTLASKRECAGKHSAQLRSHWQQGQRAAHKPWW